jgi:sugar/nucleoside kinase (ribokinase family)
MAAKFDCIVCGTCVVDILVRPVSLDQAIGGNRLFHVGPIETTVGGIVSNAGTALARFGLNVAAMTLVGDDAWAAILREHFRQEGIDDTLVTSRPGVVTSTTAVLIAADGERSFAHHVGAPARLTKADFIDRLETFARSRMALVGYYALLPDLEPDLPEVFERIRATGCRTALDAAGDGGTMDPLERVLPHTDVYVPSYDEARNQTGEDDPEKIINQYRRSGAAGVVGVKLGSRGALVSAADGQLCEVPVCQPPGEVLDTTGAGDAFCAGLVAGILCGFEVSEAARLASATAAMCVTAYGATAGLGDRKAVTNLAGLTLSSG